MMKFSTRFPHLAEQSVENSVYLKCQIKHRFVLFNGCNMDSS